MKSLSQIEPRTPVDSTHTPGTGGFGELFIISQPGSYYLTSNVVGSLGVDGIEIAANNVTLDLNGFSVLGTSNANNGIMIPNNSLSNITVRNGMVSSWGTNQSGILTYGSHVTLEHLTVAANGIGVFCLGDTVIQDCVISGNIEDGIYLGGPGGCLVIGNNCVSNNTENFMGGATIAAGSPNNRIEANHVTGSGVAGKGILVVNNPAYTNNIVVKNSVEGGGANNYSFNTSAVVGPLITNTVSGVITNSNPWSNFSF